ncbi:uncharacterized protein CCOS01_11887 [Colletotrichum costaricense]|uniref:GST N-terminal domain-containing protein n=1 Tax=Colletotrichum costaricense TaxID=1209916 RepID=A0AAJ0DWR7_9PEZI|nr:uncharacterized protein CCOS01_11887 [Colletotrichum costaricense]KAK1517630.1 hypothetical protein CCOS01_11887 [Colletotrichum costaricense]
MPEKLIFFDIPDRNGACWSLNPWKTRLTLNYKGIDYKTEWLEYPDIEPRLKPTGLEGDPDQIKPYTCPTVQYPDGTYIMNSAKIIKRIEADYPEPPLYIDSEVLQPMYDLLSKTFGALVAVLLPNVPRKMLGEYSAEYFHRTRAEMFGVSLDELEKTKGGDEAWANAKQPLEGLAKLLDKTDGPYFLGDKVSYTDFVFVGFLYFVKRAGEEHYQRVVQHCESFDKIYQACEKWLERNDH